MNKQAYLPHDSIPRGTSIPFGAIEPKELKRELGPEHGANVHYRATP